MKQSLVQASWSTPMRALLVFSLFYKREIEAQEGENVWKVTQPVSGRAGGQTQAALTFTCNASPHVVVVAAEARPLESQVLKRKSLGLYLFNKHYWGHFLGQVSCQVLGIQLWGKQVNFSHKFIVLRIPNTGEKKERVHSGAPDPAHMGLQEPITKFSEILQADS